MRLPYICLYIWWLTGGLSGAAVQSQTRRSPDDRDTDPTDAWGSRRLTVAARDTRPARPPKGHVTGGVRYDRGRRPSMLRAVSRVAILCQGTCMRPLLCTTSPKCRRSCMWGSGRGVDVGNFPWLGCPNESYIALFAKAISKESNIHHQTA